MRSIHAADPRDGISRMMRVVKGACPHDCPDTCALDVHVEDGVAIKVTGSAGHGPTAGVLCTKVARCTGGSNAITSSVHFWARAQQAKRLGARLVAIDPYRSLTAEKCHTHIALLPGTDAALALGLMHVLIRDDLIDHDYVSRHTLGFDELCERVN